MKISWSGRWKRPFSARAREIWRHFFREATAGRCLDVETVRHDKRTKRFVMTLENDEAHLAYTQEGDVLHFYYTFVPETHRGRGLAETIVRSGFDYAKEKGLTVLPTCPYITGTFLVRHPEYRTLLAEE
ncbi:MAG: GNAT family N-acetyltransferase [Candidatus Omnitrophota bacterium]